MTSATLGSLTVTNQSGFALSCGHSSYLNGLFGNPFCCRINTSSGETTCNLATGGSGASWAATAFGYPGLNANTGATTCGQGTSYSLGANGPVNVPF
ncbi:MAG: hypothetical protein IAE78_01045 [Myxococcus sp.]|nr:hypothetical protein [Myxococcus sp.]